MTSRPSSLSGMAGRVLLPNHRAVLSMWEAVMESARDRPGYPPEGAILVAPSTSDSADLIAPITSTDPEALFGDVLGLVQEAKDKHLLADPCAWLAIAAPCFITPGEVTAEQFSGAVRQAFIDGAEDAHSAVAVFIISQGLPYAVQPRVTLRLYVQPLLESVGRETKIITEGLTVQVLTKALAHASQP